MEIPPTDEDGWLLEEEELVLQEVSLLGGSQAETRPNDSETKEPNCMATLVAWVFASVFRTEKVDPAASPYEEG